MTEGGNGFFFARVGSFSCSFFQFLVSSFNFQAAAGLPLWVFTPPPHPAAFADERVGPFSSPFF